MGTKADDDRRGRQTGEGSLILVVDDEEIIHESLRRILGRQGHRVDAVFRASEALARLASARYDLVITDLMMPAVNGIQLLEIMRAEGHDVPVLMITGYPTIRTAVQALRLGAVDYLSKPFTRQEVMGPVNRTLRRAKSAASASREGEAPAAAGEVEAADFGPGDRFHLREHSWAVFQHDGAVKVGIEPSFLGSLDAVVSLEAPGESDVIEQGFVAFRLKTESGELHNVFAPLSGQVVATNREALDDPSSIGSETWLVLVSPNRLESELPLLVRS
jgi:CheY-like chemotaxis protein